jgi:6-phosphogluconolactonase/glucosamine-6-phosphate isomerase/deaminase
MDIRVTDDEATAAVAGAEWIAAQLANAVRRRGSATIALSGGSGPIPMFHRLATLDLPWKEVTVYQVDERVAPDGDSARNANALAVLPLRHTQLKLMPVTADDLCGAARRYAASLPDRFDVVHLGLGPDGHTASWAPGDPVIDDPAPVALCGMFNGYRRMTLTPAVVNAARHRLMHAPGVEKAAPLARWLLHDQALPVERVHRTNTLLIIDRAAAADLPFAGR